MQPSVTSNKRIAKNTLFLYLRMIFIMAVTLYTSRVVLEALGVSDFGVYNVVGGFSASLVFFSSALTNATQRFLNYEHGIGNKKKLNDIFNLSFWIYTFIAIIIVILGITLGTWFITHYLKIPSSVIKAACIILYSTLSSLLFSFIGSVYDSVLIARENMKIYAYVGILDAVGRLGVAFFIINLTSDKLILYSILLAIVHVLPKLGLIIYCRSRYEETKLRLFWDKKLFKQLIGFAGWNIYGTGVWMINQQGINIVLNIFFGPVVNAARGIAAQVTAAISNLYVNFFTAVRPQIVKSYAANEINRFVELIYTSSKYSVYLIWFICLPLFLRTSDILSFWLKEVPDYTSIFIKWVILFVICDTLNNPLWCAIQAIGNLKGTILYGSTFYLLAFPMSYLALKYGAPAWSVYPILTIFRIGYLFIVFRILRKFVPIQGFKYVKVVLLPIFFTLSISFIISSLINDIVPNTFIGTVIMLILITIIITFTVLIVGLDNKERKFVVTKLCRKFYK